MLRLEREPHNIHETNPFHIRIHDTTSSSSDFGLRASFGFRTSDFGFPLPHACPLEAPRNRGAPELLAAWCGVRVRAFRRRGRIDCRRVTMRIPGESVGD